MTIRRSRVIGPKRGGTVPDRWVVVTVKGESTLLGSDGSHRVERFASGLVSYCGIDGSLSTQIYNDPATLWHDVAAFARWGRRLWVFAHGMGRAVILTRLCELIESGEFEVLEGAIVLDDPPFLLSVRDTVRRTTLLLVDVRNYLRVPLETLSELFSGERPVEALVASLVRFVGDIDGGPLKATAASQSYSIWRHGFMLHGIRIHNHEKLLTLERDAYRGGRNECFRIGDVNEPIYELDFRALYATVARDLQLPVGVRGYREGGSLAALYWLAKHFLVIAEVKLSTTVDSYIDGPKRRKGFVTGDFWTVLCGAELGRALRLGHVTACGRIGWYVGSPIFRDYYTVMLRLRREYEEAGDTGMSLIVKMMCNSLIGKFGQRNSRWVDVPKAIARMPFGVWWGVSCGSSKVARWRSVGWRVQREQEREEHDYSFPAIAAFVTSAGREKLREALEIAGEHNTYYCDTDSLLVNGTGYSCLEERGFIHDSADGCLRVVESHAGGHFTGVKAYHIGGRSVYAGLPQTVERLRGVGICHFRAQTIGQTLAAASMGVRHEHRVEWRG